MRPAIVLGYIVAALVVCLHAIVRADPVSWTPGTSGQWTNASNWSSNPNLPGPADDVTISGPSGGYVVTLSSQDQSIQSLVAAEEVVLSGASLSISGTSQFNGGVNVSSGTLSLGDDSQIANATLGSGGMLGGAGAVTFSGNVSFGGATLNGQGGYTIAAGTAVTVGTYGVTLNTNLLNNGNWTQNSSNGNGYLGIAAGATLTNAGTFTVIGTVVNGGGTLANTGTLNVSNGGYVAAALDNSGTVTVAGSTVQFTGAFTNEPGATLNLSYPGTLLVTGPASLSGAINNNSYTLTFSGNTAINADASLSGYMTFAGNTTLAGAWSQPNASPTFSGTITFPQAVSTPIGIGAGGSATFNGPITAAISIGGQATVNQDVPAASGWSFNYAGVLSGPGAVTFTDTLYLGGATINGPGARTIASGTAVTVGTYGVNLNTNLLNNGNWTQNSSNGNGYLGIAAGATLTNAGTFTVIGTVVNGGGTLANTGTLNISNGGYVAAALDNSGTVTVAGSAVQFTGAFTNEPGATLNLSYPGTLLVTGPASLSGAINNNSYTLTFSGNTAINADASLSGYMTFAGNTTLAGAWSQPNASPTFSGTITFPQAVSTPIGIGAGGSATFNGPITAAISIGGQATVNQDVPAASGWSFNYAGVLSGPGAVTFTDTLYLGGATINGPGARTIASGTAVTVGTYGVNLNTNLLNNGNWTQNSSNGNGYLGIAAGATLTNAGTFTVNGTVVNGGGTLANTGTLNVSNGGYVAAALDNSGTVTVAGSTVQFTGAFTNEPGATLNLSYPGTLLVTGPASLSGAINNNSYTLTFSGNTAINADASLSGYMTFAGNTTLAGAWSQPNASPTFSGTITFPQAVSTPIGIGAGGSATFNGPITAAISIGGQATVNQDVPAASGWSFNYAGVLSGPGAVTFTDTLYLGGATINGPGARTIASGTAVTVGTYGVNLNTNLLNNGNWTQNSSNGNGYLGIAAGATLTNAGTFTVIGTVVNGGGTLANTGTLNVSNGGYVAAALDNSGTVTVAGSTVQFTGAFTNEPGATLNLSYPGTLLVTGPASLSGAINNNSYTLTFSGNTAINADASLSGYMTFAGNTTLAGAWSQPNASPTFSGTITFPQAVSTPIGIGAGGSATFNGPITAAISIGGQATVNQDVPAASGWSFNYAGVLSGPGAVTFTDTLYLGGATINGPGARTIASGTAVTVGTYGVTLNTNLLNNGNWTQNSSNGNGYLGIAAGATLTNAGTFTVIGTVVNGGGTLANTGTLNVSNGGYVAAALDNSGTVTVAGSAVQFTGAFTNEPGATLSLAYPGNLTVTGPASLSGTIGGAIGNQASLTFTGATTINADASLSGQMTFAGNTTVAGVWNQPNASPTFSGTITFPQAVSTPIGIGASGSATFNGPITAAISIDGQATVNQDVPAASGWNFTYAGVLSGPGAVTFTDTLYLGGATINGPGARTIAPGTAVTVGSYGAGLTTNLVSYGNCAQSFPGGNDYSEFSIAPGVTFTNAGTYTLTSSFSIDSSAIPNYTVSAINGGGTIANSGSFSVTHASSSIPVPTPQVLNVAFDNQRGGTLTVGGTAQVQISGAFTNEPGATLSLAYPGNLLITGPASLSGAIEGAIGNQASLTFSGPTTINADASLSGQMTFAGNTTVSVAWNQPNASPTFAGTITFPQAVSTPIGIGASGSATFNGPITAALSIDGQATVNQDVPAASGWNFTYAGVLSGPGAVTFTDTLYLGGATINGPGARTIAPGTAVTVGSYGAGLTTNLVSYGNCAQSFPGGNDYSEFSIAPGVTFTNAGTYTLTSSFSIDSSAIPNYTVSAINGGGTIANSGSFSVTHASSSIPVPTPQVLNVAFDNQRGGTLTVGGTAQVQISGAFTNEPGATLSLAYPGNLLITGPASLSGAIEGAIGNQASLTFSGPTTINADASLSGQMTFAGNTTVSVAWNQPNASPTFAGTITFPQAVSTPIGIGASGSATFNGPITAALSIDGQATVNQDVPAASGWNFTYAGVLSGPGAVTFTDTLYLGGATINGPGARTIASGTAVTVGTYGVNLNANLLNNGNWTQNSSNGYGYLGIAAGATLTNAGTFTVIGTVVNGGGTLVNTGTLNVSNDGYVAAALDNSGTVTVAGSAVQFTGAFTNEPGATLNLAYPGNLTVTGPASLSGTIGGAIGNQASLTFTGATTINADASLSGQMTFAGNTTVSGRWYQPGASVSITGSATFGGPVDSAVSVPAGGSATFNGPVSVAPETGGALNFNAGGTAGLIIDKGTATFAAPPAAPAFQSVSGTGGALNVSGALNASLISLSAGTATLWPGGQVNATDLVLSGGTTVVMGGTSAGAIAVTGKLSLTGGSLTLNADAVNPGRLLLSGTLSVTSTNATVGTSTPASGQSPGVVDLAGGTRVFDVEATSSASLVISASLVDGGIMKQGPGMLTLSGPNSLNQGVVVSNGTLDLAAPSSFSGGIVATQNGPLSGTVQVNNDAELGAASNTITLSGGTLSATASFTTSRSIFLGNPVGDGTVGVTSGNTLTLSGSITGTANLLAAGPGTLELNSAAQYAGQTHVTGGTLLLGPSGSITRSYLVAVDAGATLDLGSQSRTIQALAGAGTVSLGSGTLTIADPGSANATIFSGTITGAGGVTRSGPGTLTLSGNSSFTGGLTATGGATDYLAGPASFKGGVTASAGGTVVASSDAALGDPSNAITLSAGTLQATSSFTTSRAISVSGTGNTIDVPAASILLASGLLSGPGNLVAGGGGTLRLTDGDTLGGSVALTSGTLALSGAGTLRSVSAFSLSSGSTLLLDDSTASGGNVGSSRLAATTPITSGGGEIQLLGAGGTSSSESLGELTLSAGQTVVSITDGIGPGSSAELLFAGLSQSRRGTEILFETGDGTTLGESDRVLLGSYAAGDMPAWASVINDGVPVSAAYDPALGVIPAAEYSPSGQPALSGGATGVPEAGAGGLLCFAALGVLRRRRDAGSGRSRLFSGS